MKLKTLALAPVLCLAMAFPALADKIPLNEISRYLNSLKTAQAGFTQVNNDGSISTGTVYIQRPNRVRSTGGCCLAAWVPAPWRFGRCVWRGCRVRRDSPHRTPVAPYSGAILLC